MLRQRTATNQLEHFHFCLLHNDAAHSVRSLAPRSEAERGEGWGEGHFFGASPSPNPPCGDHRGALSPQAGRGRNNYDRTRGHISPFFHTALLVPAARFCARVLKLWLRYPDRRVAERRESSGACEAPVRPARNAAGQAPNEAPCVPYGGRPPPGALTVAILGSGPALPSPELLPDRSQRAPRVRVVVPGGRGPVPPGAAVVNRCRRTPRLAPSSGCLRTTPLRERGWTCMYYRRNL